MKKYLLHIVLFFCFTQLFHAQEEDGVVSFALPVRNSLKFNRFAINPTFSFVREQNKYISFNNKRQWVQFDDAPQTYLFGYSGRFRENIGVGINLFQQNYGVLTTFGGILNFAYNVVLERDSNLTFGLNLGFYKSSLNEGKVVTNFPDPSLDNIPSNSLLTVNPGINYGTGFVDFGVSLNNIFLYNLNTSKIIEDDPEKSVQVHAMYTGYVNSRDFFDESKFSGLVRSEFKKDKTVISGIAMLTVPKGIWAQAGYNTLYGLFGGLGINITSQISIEYNYEKAMGNLSNFGSSHDITLAYRFKNKYRYRYSGDDEESSMIIPEKKTRRVVARRRTSAKPKTPVTRKTQAQIKAEADARAKAAAEAREKELAERAAAKAEEEARAKSAAEAAAAKAKVEEEARAKGATDAAAAKAKAEEEARAKAAAEAAAAKAKAEEEARAKAAAEAAAAKAKAEEEARAKAAAEAVAAKAKAEEEARAKAAAEAAAAKAKAEEEARAKAAAEAAAAKAKAEEEARAKAAAEAAAAKAKAEEEARAKAAAEAAAAKAKAEEEARAKAAAEAEAAKAKAEEEARAKAAAEAAAAKAKAEEEARAKAAAEAAAKAKAEEEARAKAAAEAAAAKAKAEEEARAKAAAEAAAAKAKAEEEARAKAAAEAAAAKAKEEVKTPVDDVTKSMNDLLTRLEATVASRDQDLKDLKEENDLGEKGIVTAPKPFKSISAENAALASLKSELDGIINTRNEKISDLEKQYSGSIDPIKLKTIERLKTEQSEALKSRENLMATLEKIKVATEIERKRRIKRAAYDNADDRYSKDMAALNRIKRTTPLSTVPLKEEDFDFGEKQSDNIQIVKDIKNAESGYYLVIAVHNDIDKRDEFVKKTISAGQADVNFFYDETTSQYFIYYEKFDSVDQATRALQSKGNKPYNGKMSMVKIEN